MDKQFGDIVTFKRRNVCNEVYQFYSSIFVNGKLSDISIARLSPLMSGSSAGHRHMIMLLEIFMINEKYEVGIYCLLDRVGYQIIFSVLDFDFNPLLFMRFIRTVLC